MAINYEKVKWNETPYKYANPENMNKMDNGIKSACDGIDSIAADYSKKCEMDELKYLGWVTPREYTGTRSSTDSNGKFNQMVGRVDLGTLSWSGSSSFQSSDLVGKAKAVATSVMPNMYSGGITVVKADNFSSADTAICIDADGRLLAKKSGVSDATAFRSAMSGVYLYYQLQTPVEWTEGSENGNSRVVMSSTHAKLVKNGKECRLYIDGARFSEIKNNFPLDAIKPIMQTRNLILGGDNGSRYVVMLMVTPSASYYGLVFKPHTSDYFELDDTRTMTLYGEIFWTTN